jgi:hypothetical protein
MLHGVHHLSIQLVHMFPYLRTHKLHSSLWLGLWCPSALPFPATTASFCFDLISICNAHLLCAGEAVVSSIVSDPVTLQATRRTPATFCSAPPSPDTECLPVLLSTRRRSLRIHHTRAVLQGLIRLHRVPFRGSVKYGALGKCEWSHRVVFLILKHSVQQCNEACP